MIMKKINERILTLVLKVNIIVNDGPFTRDKRFLLLRAQKTQ